MYVKARMDEGFYKKGTLPDSNPVVVTMEHAPLPATVFLDSSDGSRKIELSLDGSIFFVPVYDSNLTNQIAISILSGVRSIRLTGVASDTWGIV